MQRIVALGRTVLAGALLAVSLAVASESAAIAPAGAAPHSATATQSPPVYRAVGRGTHFIDDAAKLAGFNDPQWYESNIPFVDLPDQQIEDVYYYRWRTWKEHLRYTNPSDGWISTEFLDCCGYAAPYQAINAAAGFHLAEGRWVRDQNYADDYIRFWLDGPGRRPQTVNPDVSDWAHEYSFWAATAVVQQAQVTGNVPLLQQLESALVRQYRGWDNHFDQRLGLYWQLPVWDAKELSPASYESSDEFAGVHTFRPSINAYQYGDALAIATVAKLAGDRATQDEYQQRASALRKHAHKWLWDPTRKFWYDIVDEHNASHRRLDTREETGFVPWQFGLAHPDDSAAWRQILDPQGFASPYGPTTTERRSRWFMHDARTGCCHWDGPSWPYSTSQELTGLANLLDDYPAQHDISSADYVSLLHTFAVTQYRDGKPYVAEAHDPDQPDWIYDGYNHSEDYNHSSFDDLVISGLIGLRPSFGTSLSIKPLAPASWDHFALENVPYHGHNVTVIWDADGSHYHQGPGMKVYVDGTLVRAADHLAAITVPIGTTDLTTQTTAVATRTANDAANPLRESYPQPIASYTWTNDSPWNAIDGKVWFNEVPEDTRWTNYASPNTQDWYGVDFGLPTRVSDVRFYGYDDGGGVRPAAAYTLQYWTGSSWSDVPGQTHSPSAPVGNGLNRITFPALRTSKIRLLFTNPSGAYVGITELQSWSPSSGDAQVRMGPQAADGTVAVDGPTDVSVAVTDRTAGVLRDASVSVAAPSGWTVRPAAAPGSTTVQPGRARTWHFTVTPPDGLRGVASPLVATAAYIDAGGVRRSTHARQTVITACDETGSRVPGRIGTAVQLCGRGEYVDLPDGLVSTLHDFTASAWVKPRTTPQWSRVFDFGTGTSAYMYLTVNSGGGIRYAITTNGGDNEQRVDAPVTLPLDTWSHLAVTQSGSTVTLYVNGKAVATNTGVTMRPADLGTTTQDWLGRSQYADPYLDGTLDDVQLYDHALSDAEVADLAAGTPGSGNVADYHFDEDGGPTVVDSSGHGRDGTIV